MGVRLWSVCRGDLREEQPSACREVQSPVVQAAYQLEESVSGQQFAAGSMPEKPDGAF
jgi:hypothetical protein